MRAQGNFLFIIVSLVDLLYGPFCMFSQHRFRVFKRAIQYGQGMHVTDVAERDCDVAQVATSFGAFDGTLLEALIKLLRCNDQLVGQGKKRIFSSKGRITFTCEAIPRADHLADITSKNPITDFFAQSDWDVIFEFDGEIGNAAGRVDRTIREDAIRGAGFDTTRAGAAVIGDERRIRFKGEIEKDFGEQKIRAVLWINETGILADPANARTLGEITLKDGACVAVPAVFYRTSDLLFDKLNEFLHPSGEDIMIVISPGIGGDFASRFLRFDYTRLVSIWRTVTTYSTSVLCAQREAGG